MRGCGRRLSGAADPTGIYPNPVDTTNVLAKIDHQVSGRDQFSVRYSRYDVGADNSRGAGGLSAPDASSGPGQHRPGDRLQQHADPVAADGARNARAVRAQRPGGAAVGPDRPGGEHRRRRDVRHQFEQPDRPPQRMFQIVNNLSHQAGAHALRAGVDFLYNDDLITFPRSVRGSYTFSSLANFLAGAYNNAGFAQTFGITEVAQTNPNLGVYVQDEWKVTPGVTLNAGRALRPAVPRNHRHRHQQRVAARRVRVDAVRVAPHHRPRQRRPVLRPRAAARAGQRAAVRRQHNRRHAPCGSIVVSLSPTQAGAPVFPNILPAAVPLVTLPNLTTMDRELQNAYSRQASAEIEQQLGARTTVSVGYQYPGRPRPADVGEPERADVRGRRHQQRLPARTRPTPTTASTRRPASRTITACTSRCRSDRRAGASTASSYTLSKSMNNVGEFFFSSPIDPTDLSKDWGRSDNDQRHRLVVNGSVHTSMEPADGVWEHLTHGFQVGGMLQAYSAPPFNITSGVTTIQGTAGRPIVDGEFIERNAGVGTAFFSSARASAARSAWPTRVAARGARRGVQPDRSRERRDAQHELRRRRVSRPARRRPSTRSPPSASRDRSSSARG